MESKPDILTKYSRHRIASIDVDAQKGFTPLCPDELPVPDGDSIVEALNEQATWAEYRIGTKDCHPRNALWEADANHPAFSQVGLPNVDIRWPRHCVVGSYGHQLLNGLPDPVEYDFFVYKGIEPDLHPYGACYHDLAHKQSTGLVEWLLNRGVELVIVGGLATDYCVCATAVQLRRKGFEVVVNLKACRGVAPDTVAKAVDDMRLLGIHILE